MQLGTTINLESYVLNWLLNGTNSDKAFRREVKRKRRNSTTFEIIYEGKYLNFLDNYLLPLSKTTNLFPDRDTGSTVLNRGDLINAILGFKKRRVYNGSTVFLEIKKIYFKGDSLFIHIIRPVVPAVYGSLNGSSYITYSAEDISFLSATSLEVEFEYMPTSTKAEHYAFGLSTTLSSNTTYLHIGFVQNAAEGCGVLVTYANGVGTFTHQTSGGEYSKLFAESTFNKYNISLNFTTNAAVFTVDDNVVYSGSDAAIIAGSITDSKAVAIGNSPATINIPLEGNFKNFDLKLSGSSILTVKDFSTGTNLESTYYQIPSVTGTITSIEI